MERVIVVHYDEIGLKGRNRSFFEGRLKRALKTAARVLSPSEILKQRGRFLVRPSVAEEAPRLARILAAQPGVRYVLLGTLTGFTETEIQEALDGLLPQQASLSFGVRVRRADKSFPLKSGELEARLGAFVLERRAWSVDLERPDLWIRVELFDGRALVTTERLEGSGGLPVGSSGKGVALLSGGIDSPVAAYAMMTRGLRLTLLHCHSAPFTSAASQEKVRELALHLARHQSPIDLVMIPFAVPVQQEIVARTKDSFRVVLYRRFMLRLADRLAREIGAGCLVTGEALGQVASQTVENMTAVQSVTDLLVLRPLVGMCKDEIVRRAQALGTFEISVQPHDDCCSYLMPRRPITHCTPEEARAAEEPLDVKALVDAAWEQRKVESVEISRALFAP